MLYIVNDTRIKILEKADSVSQGGTSAYLAGFINYLLQKKMKFGMIGNFEISEKAKKAVHFSHPSSNAAFLKFLFKLFLVNKFNQKDIFYFQRPDHLACSLLSNNKIRILHLHGQPRTTVIHKKNSITKLSYLLLERLAMRYADLILATDNLSAAVYLSQYPFIKKKLNVVPTGIDLTFFAGSKEQSAQDGFGQRKELVYIGRLAPPKKIIEMLRAFRIVSETFKNCHFSIAGTGPLLNNLKLSIHEMGLEDKVSFRGLLSKNQVRELIYNSDAAILLSANEGSPVSIKEVLASGKPVVVNDVGDITDYVNHEKNGYIVDADNSDEVAAAIASAFANSANMREACISSMTPYDESLINHKIAEYILNVNKSK